MMQVGSVVSSCWGCVGAARRLHCNLFHTSVAKYHASTPHLHADAGALHRRPRPRGQSIRAMRSERADKEWRRVRWPRSWKDGQRSGESRHVGQHVQRAEASRCAWPHNLHDGRPLPVRERIVRRSLYLTKWRRQKGMNRLAMERMGRNALRYYVLGERRIPTSRMQDIRKDKGGLDINTPRHHCLLGSGPSF